MDVEYHRSEIELVQNLLNTLVHEYKLKYVTIAREIGCAEESVRSWHRGKRCPQPEFREKILILLQGIQAGDAVPKNTSGRSFYGRKKAC